MIATPRFALPRRFLAPLATANVLLAAALFVLHLGASREAPAPVSESKLASLPREVAGWQGKDGEWESETVTAIGAEDWLLRRYQDELGSAFWLYVGFHNNASFTGTSPHSPLLCYPGQGWTVLDSSIERIPLAAGGSIPINRMLVQKGREQRLVLYWLQWGREVTTESAGGDYVAKLLWLMRLPFLVQEDARTDRSLVRVSARVELSPDRTFTAGANFVAAVFPLLAEHFEIVMAAAPADGEEDRTTR